MYADQVGQRSSTPSLDIDDVLLLAIRFHDKGTEKTQRRSAIQGVTGHQRQKARVAAGLGGDQFAQLLDQVSLTTDRLQIKEDVAVEQGLRVRAFYPVVEIALPDRERLAPLLVGGHDVALAVGITTGGKTIADESRQSQKVIIMLFWIKTVIQHQGV